MRSSREQFGRVCDRFRLWVACYSFRLSSWHQFYSHTQQWGGFYSFIVTTWVYIAFVRPSWLAEAHRKLDAAVFAAYGWPVTLTDAELLECLLALNHERAVASQG
jgi:hypothetical protein